MKSSFCFLRAKFAQKSISFGRTFSGIGLLLLLLISWSVPSQAQTLLLRYSFDEANNGNANALDLGLAPVADGVFQGSATRTASTPGNFSTGALDISPSALTDYISGGDADKVLNLSQMTMTAWINMQGNPSFADRVLSKSVPGPLGIDWTISVGAAPLFRFNLVVGTDAGFTIASSADTIDANQRWIFASITYDAAVTTANVNFYIGDETNAVVLHSTANQDRGPAPLNDGDFRVGSTGASPSDRTPTAFIDDVRIYSGILTPAQLEVVRQANLPSQIPPAQPVQILNPSRDGNGISFSFVTQNGHTHTVEYKNNLSDALWQTLTTITGSGAVTNITDSGAAARYYRVGTQ